MSNNIVKLTKTNGRKPVAIGQLTMSASAPGNLDSYSEFSIGVFVEDMNDSPSFRLNLDREGAQALSVFLNRALACTRKAGTIC